MEKSIGKLEKLERDINAILILLGLILALYILYIIGQVYCKGWGSLPLLVGAAIPMVSVVLGGLIASRALEHQRVAEQNRHARDAVQCLHHMMAIIKDIEGRLGFMVATLIDDRKLNGVFVQGNIEKIESRYEVLFDRNNYRFIHGSSIDLINRMSGSVYGASCLFKSLIVNDNEIVSFEKINKAKVVDSLRGLQDELRLLDEEIRVLRLNTSLN